MSSKFPELLSRAKKRNSSFLSWVIVGDTLVKSEFSLKSYKVDRELTLMLSGQAESSLKYMVNGMGVIFFYCFEERVIFASYVKKVDGHEICVEYPIIYNEFDRRENERLHKASLIHVEIKVREKTIKAECFDFSSGGFSILLPERESKEMKEGDLYDIFFEFGQARLSLKAKHLRQKKLPIFTSETSPYATIKKSFEFVSLNEETKQAILETVAAYREISINSL